MFKPKKIGPVPDKDNVYGDNSVKERLEQGYNEIKYKKFNMSNSTLEVNGYIVPIKKEVYYILHTVLDFKANNNIEKVIKVDIILNCLRAVLKQPHTFNINLDASEEYVSVQKQFKAFIQREGVFR